MCSRPGAEWNGERAITDSGNQIWLEMQFPKVWSSLIVKVQFGMKKESLNFYTVQGGPKKDQSDFEIIFAWKNYVIEIETLLKGQRISI